MGGGVGPGGGALVGRLGWPGGKWTQVWAPEMSVGVIDTNTCGREFRIGFSRKLPGAGEASAAPGLDVTVSRAGPTPAVARHVGGFIRG